MFFSGQSGPQRKVSLRGQGDRAQETKEQVLQRTQREREARRRQKLENRSATVIQVRVPPCRQGSGA